MAISCLQTLQLEHLPPGYVIHIALYKDLQNADFLQKQLLEGNTAYEYALIDASVIISQIHILSAIYRATNDLIENRLRSRNVHSEIVFSLSPNNNIAASFRTFGVVPATKNLILIKVATPSTPEVTAESVGAHISSAIQGQQVSFNDEEIAKMTDWSKVKKIYKLSTVPAVGVGKKVPNGVADSPCGDELEELEVVILGSMALRGAAN